MLDKDIHWRGKATDTILRENIHLYSISEVLLFLRHSHHSLIVDVEYERHLCIFLLIHALIVLLLSTPRAPVLSVHNLGHYGDLDALSSPVVRSFFFIRAIRQILQ